LFIQKPVVLNSQVKFIPNNQNNRVTTTQLVQQVPQINSRPLTYQNNAKPTILLPSQSPSQVTVQQSAQSQPSPLQPQTVVAVNNQFPSQNHSSTPN
jgi:hypothetical protein